MKFRNSTSPERERTFLNPGCRFKKNYKPVFDEHGHFELEETESSDLYEYIQSFRESTDVKCIIERFLKTGGVDTSILQRVEPIFMDLSEIPDNARDWLNLSVYAQNEFFKLPVEIKEKFNNSFEQFLVSMGSEGFFEKLGVVSDVRKDDTGISGAVESSVGENGEKADGE